MNGWGCFNHALIIIGKNIWIEEYYRFCKRGAIGDAPLVAVGTVVTKKHTS